MQQLWHQHRERPSLLPQLWRQALIDRLWHAATVVALLLPLLLHPAGAAAAEMQQIRTATVLQVGDSNRSYTVRLACIAVAPDQQELAVRWLRQTATRGTRVNLRPMGEQNGQLLARVTTLPRGGKTGIDLGASLVAEGLATRLPASLVDASCNVAA